MKRMKKAAALLLALTMTLALSVNVFAVHRTYNMTNGVAKNDGTISISGIHVGEGGHSTEYEVYKMLHLESYQAASGSQEDAYSYVIVDEWEDFFKNDDIAKKYIKINTSGYVSWQGGQTAADLNEFAGAALQYAKDEGIAPIMTTANAYSGGTGYQIVGTTGTFHGLSLGYYLIDSNVGILCGLTTTNPDATVVAKNGAPTLIKQVEEDSAAGTGTNSWFDENSADIGQVVKFDISINAHAGAENYVFYDRMSEGLTFHYIAEPDPAHNLHVYHHDPNTNVTTELTHGTYYTVTVSTTGAPLKDGADFKIVFSEAFCKSLQTNDKIYITYEAILNENAVVGGSGNHNEAWVDYGEEHHTAVDETTTYTYGFDLVKTNSANKLINGAVFKLYNHIPTTDDTNTIKFVKESEKVYRRAKDGEAGATDEITVTNGMVEIHGLDNGRYYMVETVAPVGYNVLNTPIEVDISDAYRKATLNAAGDTLVAEGNPVQVINNTGAMLPSTGGMGTTLFIIFGVIAVLGTGMLLVTKKRMGMIRD